MWPSACTRCCVLGACIDTTGQNKVWQNPPLQRGRSVQSARCGWAGSLDGSKPSIWASSVLTGEKWPRRDLLVTTYPSIGLVDWLSMTSA